MMDKTININIAGTLFHIDEEAYRYLRDYLQEINLRFKNVKGGLETIEDIESRIAEIFQSQSSNAGAITKENIDAMIKIIGKPEDFDLNVLEEETQAAAPQRKRMYRNPEDSIISGVCGGIGAYLNTDPVIFRILFILFTFTFGVGFFIYLALWIALPSANTETRKREMYGTAYIGRSQSRHSGGTYNSDSQLYNKGYNNSSKIGNAFNEVFRAIGRVFYIILRIILILLGAVLVLTGFLLILNFVLILIFKYPDSYYSSGMDVNLTYFADFLNYVVDPALVPWIIVLTLIALVLPMLAIIYWGVKMIFWFRAKDGVFSLIGLIVWVLILATLAVILFSEGLSFAETAKSSKQIVLPHPPKTLYIKANNKISGLNYDKELRMKEDGYNIFVNEEKKELYIRPYLDVFSSDGEVARIELRKRSSGRGESDAMKKTEDLIYNYSISGDTLYLDEYFTIPAGRKWAADNVGINLYIPVGTFLKIDGASEKLFHLRTCKENDEYYDYDDQGSGIRSWILTEDGLEPEVKPSENR